MIQTNITGPGLPEPKPITRYGGGAEYKLLRLRETPFNAEGDTPEAIVAFWKANVVTAAWYREEQEAFVVIMLSCRRKIIGFHLVTLGTIDTCHAHPREVYRAAIIAGAAAVVLMHNHPSGDPSPSEADVKVTRDLIRAGQLLKVECLDSIVVGTATAERPKDYTSLRELGYFYS